jgi:hypothetical protein
MSPKGILGAAIAAFCCAGAAVTVLYGFGNFFAGFVGNFGASLLAFMLALAWERDREQRQMQRSVRDTENQRATELRRRLSPIHRELAKNLESLEYLTGKLGDPFATGGGGFQLLHPQLLDVAWAANAPQVSQLAADYELVADLATAYGRIEELRWRLRYRSDHVTAVIDEMTAPLVDELRDEVNDLSARVAAQIDKPAVQELGLVENVPLSTGVTTTAAVLSRRQR